MTDEAMSPLRPRMIEDMTIRKLGRKTQQDYIQIIKKLAAFLGRSPDTATSGTVAVVSALTLATIPLAFLLKDPRDTASGNQWRPS